MNRHPAKVMDWMNIVMPDEMVSSMEEMASSIGIILGPHHRDYFHSLKFPNTFNLGNALIVSEKS